MDALRYSTVVVDPPWNYNDKLQSGNSGFGEAHLTRGAANHYATLTPDEIAQFPISELAADDAHLYIWVTNAFMVEAHALMKAWGFEHKTILTWFKTVNAGDRPRIGMGHYYRGATEHVLFGVRGKLPPLVRNAPTWFFAPRGAHSAKPNEFFELVESVSPAPRLDVFARTQRQGWDVFGNEVAGSIELPVLSEEVA